MQIKWIRQRKIRLTVLFSGIVAFSILMMLVISVGASYKSQRESLEERTMEMDYSSAQNMRNTIDTLFTSMKNGLAAVARQVSEVDPSEPSAGIQEQLDFFKGSNNYFNSVFWADAKGTIIKITPPNLHMEGVQIRTRPVKEALALKQPTLSVPYVGTTGRLIVLMTQPVFDAEGSYKGFIGGTIYLEESNILNNIFGQNHIDETGSYFYIVDSTGKLMFHPDDRRLGTDVSGNPAVKKLAQGLSGKEVAKNSAGVRFMTGFAYVIQNGWGVVVQTPLSVVTQQQNEQLKEMVAITIVPFLLLMVLTVVLARRVSAPFVALSDFSSRMASGNGKIKTPPLKSYWIREADLLSKAVTKSLGTMQERNNQLNDTALKDPLTGLRNRRSFDELAFSYRQTGQPFSLLMLDIDRFKSINDTFGHQAGDEVLKMIAKLITASIRPGDSCFRFGGEEFVVVLPNTQLEQAYASAERIRRIIGMADMPTDRQVTVSIGGAAYPSQAADFEMLFQLADKALYQAKEGGRNRTVLAPHKSDINQNKSSKG